MNYDLLKLSKILPTLNGKKTIDVFQERLDYARAQQGGEIIQEPAKQQFSTLEIQRGRSKPTKKESRGVGDSQSSGNILMGNYSFPIKDYSNLQVLLEGDEEADHFAHMFKNSFRTESHKNQKNSFQSTGNSFFGKKNASEVSFQVRPITTTSTQSNFVFRKKKADFVNKFQTESMYNYGLEKISHTIPDDSFGLNGKKMSMREMTNDVVVRQQKKYLKELKLDPLTIFRSKLPGTDEGSESPQRLTRDTLSPSGGYKKPFLISRCNQRSLKKNLQKSQQSFHLNYREAKPDSTRNTLTLDGSQFRPAEQNKTHETPTVTPKKHSKGFSQYVNTLE